MRGQLKNKFIVLSDDRILPPYQGGKGKRAHPGDDEVNPASVKRQHHNPPPSTSSYVQVVQGMTPHVQLVPGVAPILQSAGSAPLVHSFTSVSPVNNPANAYFPPLPASTHLMAYTPGQGQIPVANTFPATNQMTVQALVHVPTPSPAPVATTNQVVAQATGQGPAHSQVIQAATFETAIQAVRPTHGYVTVQNKKKVRGKKKGGESNPSRLTPSRLAKDKSKAQSAPMEVTSPNENYESCDDSTASVEDDQDIVKTAS